VNSWFHCSLFSTLYLFDTATDYASRSFQTRHDRGGG
jgi:hypothetical protein